MLRKLMLQERRDTNMSISCLMEESSSDYRSSNSKNSLFFLFLQCVRIYRTVYQSEDYSSLRECFFECHFILLSLHYLTEQIILREIAKDPLLEFLDVYCSLAGEFCHDKEVCNLIWFLRGHNTKLEKRKSLNRKHNW